MGVRYSASVHAYSNLRMEAAVDATSFEPGATLNVRARLTEYGAPFRGWATVRAEVTRPDGVLSDLALPPTNADGEFAAAVTATQTGVYRFRILASGRTSDELPFSREQIRTAAVWHGGDNPEPPRGTGPGGTRPGGTGPGGTGPGGTGPGGTGPGGSGPGGGGPGSDLCRLIECLFTQARDAYRFDP